MKRVEPTRARARYLVDCLCSGGIVLKLSERRADETLVRFGSVWYCRSLRGALGSISKVDDDDDDDDDRLVAEVSGAVGTSSDAASEGGDETVVWQEAKTGEGRWSSEREYGRLGFAMPPRGFCAELAVRRWRQHVCVRDADAGASVGNGGTSGGVSDVGTKASLVWCSMVAGVRG